MKNKKIPIGHYCYTIDYDNYDSAHPDITPIIECPYKGIIEINGVSLPHCSYLNKAGMRNNIEDDDFEKLVHHFGSIDEVFNNLPLDLLWDGCKECGENYEEDD